MLRKRIQSKEERNDTSNERQPEISQTNNRTLYRFIKFILCLFVVLYIIIPAVFYYSSSIRRHVVFLNYVSFPLPHSIEEPHKFELNCARNFYINSESEIKLGVWHIPSKSSLKYCKEGKLETGKEFADDRPIFLYLHGNSGTRGGGHRVQLYKLLSNNVDVHIITFDYRGYADSTNVPPSADGVLHDATVMYNWIKKYRTKSQIYIWGHSLGTAVAVRLVTNLCENEEGPAALILEAPFTTIQDAASYYPLSIFHRYMPLFETIFINSMKSEETHFDSETLIGKVKIPLLILHAQDDGLVPFELGDRLHRKAMQDRPPELVSPIFISFDYVFNYGHKHIHRYPLLPDLVIQFMKGKLKSKFIKSSDT